MSSSPILPPIPPSDDEPFYASDLENDSSWMLNELNIKSSKQPGLPKNTTPNDERYEHEEDIQVAGVIGINNEEMMETPNKRRQSRYFDNLDISIKCYNCGIAGHTSSACTSARHVTCYLCGNLNHIAMHCPYDTCWKCGKSGHFAFNCTNPKIVKEINCFKCGNIGHLDPHCKDSNHNNMHSSRCIVCGEYGHLNCVVKNTKSPKFNAHNNPACLNCSSTLHTYEKCMLSNTTDSLKNMGWSIADAIRGESKMNTPSTPTMKCFKCNQVGHMAKFCTSSSNNRSPKYVPLNSKTGYSKPNVKNQIMNDAFSSKSTKVIMKKSKYASTLKKSANKSPRFGSITKDSKPKKKK